ncbi:hypothetical protein Pcar_3374 [Syntrophotalea carbinolica DSM 2380]|uniref:Uncharacterized protein n=1 Tax=Syntrophotalea carbinolica (strain DSM 2380 / NBRC 103641 / GraBd1) TaxID=338963 RepID=Q0C6E9_SYNC1|nr:hypothetical protein Pcar_3374 [Syntrophotalea carbinolica DSM 2380]
MCGVFGIYCRNNYFTRCVVCLICLYSRNRFTFLFCRQNVCIVPASLAGQEMWAFCMSPEGRMRA